MGLDTVELVMNIEETFDFTIPNRDAERLLTVGDIYRYILDRITIDPTATCLSRAAFYRSRRVLMDAVGAGRADIRPATPLEAVIPREDRKSSWQRLALALGLDLPRLRRPLAMEMSLIWTKLLILPLIPFVFAMSARVGQGVAAWAVVGLIIDEILLSILIHTLTEPYALEFAPNCRTIRGLVEILVDRDRERTITHHEEPCWNEVKVWETLRSILVGQWGIDPEAVTEDARIIDFFC